MASLGVGTAMKLKDKRRPIPVTERVGLDFTRYFTVRQESVAQPPVGPALRPPPKPTPRPGASNKLPTSQATYAALNGGRTAMDPVTNRSVVTKPAPAKPAVPGPRQGK